MKQSTDGELISGNIYNELNTVRIVCKLSYGEYGITIMDEVEKRLDAAVNARSYIVQHVRKSLEISDDLEEALKLLDPIADEYYAYLEEREEVNNAWRE